MPQVSKFLRKVFNSYYHYCPGCKEMHGVRTSSEGRPVWTFNGSVEKPTYHPSVRHFHPAANGRPEETYCHYFIKDGIIEFCGDCNHEFSGKHVPLQEIPERYNDTSYGWPE